MTRTTTRTVALGLMLVAGLAACGTDDTGAASSPAAPSASPAPASAPAAGAVTGAVTAEDQSGDGTTLTVASVELAGAEQGWIAVHQDLDGKPGPVVGTLQVEQGSTTDLVVELDEPVLTGDYWPMLHVDDTTPGEYEFLAVEGADLPVLDGEMPVMQMLTLSVG
ncbi:DUF7282 domain-containing protein [Aquipuribacter hungaricus]|uniref:DUF7282 domain-containing protein n=1 Tax=Aquipuribacter hungaricus TaxID=545624 RepID=A0ABV7WJZ1_9MICO